MYAIRRPRLFCAADAMMLNASVGNDPGGRFVAAPFSVNGAVLVANWPNKYGRGSTSNIPKPPRPEVLPSPNGSHAKPTLGSKLRSVGLLKTDEPTTIV